MLFFLFFPLFVLFGDAQAFAPLNHHRHSRLATPNFHVDEVPATRTRHLSSVLSLRAKLWDRLEIEEDPEPMWYLINCVAGLEIDLLRQCREICSDMPDAIKFVVPTERKTRSHGAKKMVTETKVKYQGYVFGKLRLCPEVYEAVQGLDLCRSWMGTVNHKGHRKLPPAPIALNEMEVENFGLEECEAEEDEEEDTGNIIVDVEDEEAESKLDKEAIKEYLGLKVEDMVKITARGKFYNEDGIIRRLKDGKLLIRFYTYGTMFEEWMNPGDVRKLSNIEILKGLSGPSRPVTQHDFDGPSQGYDEGRPGDLRRNLMSNVGGGGGYGQRNRRQDRNERRFRRDNFRDDEQRGRNDRNWNWYQDQQQDTRRRNDYGGRSYGYQAGSRGGPRRDRGGDWAIGNVDSQWGRNSSPNQNNDRRDRRPRQNFRRDNDRADAAIRGDDDWSAYVTQSGSAKGSGSGGNRDDDDFFASLMNDLSDDLGSKSPSSSRSGYAVSDSSNNNNDDDDFFSSLMSEISDENSSPNNAQTKSSDNDDDDFFSSLMSDISGADSSPRAKPQNRSRPKQPPRSSPNNEDENFFAALEAELGSAIDDSDPSTSKLDHADDLFAKLEAELSPKSEPAEKKSKGWSTTKQPEAEFAADDDFFAQLEVELSPSLSSATVAANGGTSEDDVFFAALEADLQPASATSTSLDDTFVDTTEVDQEVEDKPKQTKKATRPKRSVDEASSSSPAPSSPAKQSSSPISAEQLTKQTVPVLKDMLRERGLKVSGKKAELIDRLLQES